jgi:hypothetical protein
MKDGNPWVQARTLFRSAVDVLRRAEVAMTAREITALHCQRGHAAHLIAIPDAAVSL